MFFAAEQDTLNALLYHGVMVDENGRLRFFHEALFDYLAALALRSSGATATSLLAAGPQELLRRGQVRALLTMMRDDLDPGYLVDLAGVLDRTTTRSHIRSAVLAMLGEMDEATAEELAVCLRIAVENTDPLRQYALGILTTARMARRLAGVGLLEVAAATVRGVAPTSQGQDTDLVVQLGAENCVQLLIRSSINEPTAAAKAAIEISSNDGRITTWIYGLLRLIHIAGPTAGEGALADLFVDLARATTAAVLNEAAYQTDIEDAVQRYSVDRAEILRRLCVALFEYGRSALATISKRTPTAAARAIRAWLDAAVKINDGRGIQSLFGSDSVIGRDATGLGVFGHTAQLAPRSFVESVLPILLHEWAATAKTFGWTPIGSEDEAPGLRYTRYLLGLSANSLEHEITDALSSAVAAAAQGEPDEMAGVLEPLHRSDLLPVHELLSHVYATAEGSLLANACDWICDPRVRGLPRGATPGWAWGEVAGRVATAGSGQQRDRVLTCIRAAATAPMIGAEAVGPPTASDHLSYEALIVLTRLKEAMGSDMPHDLSERLDELVTIQGRAPDQPVPYTKFIEMHSQRDIPSNLTDVEWLVRIGRVTESMAAEATDRSEDELYDTTTGLSQSAATEPARFARVGASLPATTPATIVSAIIRAVADSISTVDGVDLGAIVDLIRAVQGRVSTESIDLDILSLINKAAALALPEDVIDLVPLLYERTLPPDTWDSSNPEVAGLYHPRGAAITSAAALLNYSATRASRLPRLTALLTRAAVDEQAPVRIWLPTALTLVHLQDPVLAGDLAEQWLANASDEELTARYLDRLVGQLAVTAPDTARSMLARMVASPNPGAKRRAGQLATLFDVRGIDVVAAGEESPLMLAMADEDGRRGIADVIVQLVDELTAEAGAPDSSGIRADQSLLVKLAADESDDIRAEIMDLARYIRRPLADYDVLFDALADTEAFLQHPGRLLHFLSQRLDDLPPAALKLCQVWTDKYGQTANDMANREMSEAPDVTDTILGLYTRAQPGSAVREQCLDLIDCFVELRIGDIETKADTADYIPRQ